MVAVKLMRKELENDPVALESFYKEARACARLNARRSPICSGLGSSGRSR